MADEKGTVLRLLNVRILETLSRHRVIREDGSNYIRGANLHSAGLRVCGPFRSSFRHIRHCQQTKAVAVGETRHRRGG